MNILHSTQKLEKEKKNKTKPLFANTKSIHIHIISSSFGFGPVSFLIHSETDLKQAILGNIISRYD